MAKTFAGIQVGCRPGIYLYPTGLQSIHTPFGMLLVMTEFQFFKIVLCPLETKLAIHGTNQKRTKLYGHARPWTFVCALSINNLNTPLPRNATAVRESPLSHAAIETIVNREISKSFSKYWSFSSMFSERWLIRASCILPPNANYQRHSVNLTLTDNHACVAVAQLCDKKSNYKWNNHEAATS